MGFLAKIVNWVATVVENFRRRRAQVNLLQKCPNCGHKQKHPIVQVFNDAGKSCVKHTCVVCAAEFMEDSVIQSDTWTKPPQPPKPPISLSK